ncbi:hypothetical protein SLEP1_g23818 [Rubroshorea leprosula]|uniref:Uncharacterized protein n=1 Tax=Rubroshorea leprosula TaxID=152421 RepID=A0AAV5JQP1_9ROSI|nr:hypothetical protein SLEP1_g23818 [Rubroshorea leprosula]
MLGSTEPSAWVRCPACLGSTEPSMPGFDETQALAVGFLQVDEEGIGAGFENEPSKQSNLALNPAAAGFLQVLGSISNPAGTVFKLGSCRCWVRSSSWVDGSVEFDLFMDLLSIVLSSYSYRCAGFDFKPSKR